MRGLPLSLHGLSFAFSKGGPPFISMDSLELEGGEYLAIAGPSGSGKSSLLFLLSAMVTPSSGSIDWGGTDVAALAEGGADAWRRKNLGVVFQDFRLVPELSALENVLLPTSFSSWSPTPALRRRALDLLEDLGLGNLARRRSGGLSRGEMQRVAVARALLFDPPLLMADEPTASLDEASGEAVAAALVEAARSGGATLVVATHHRSLRDRADRVLHLDHGRPVPAPGEDPVA